MLRILLVLVIAVIVPNLALAETVVLCKAHDLFGREMELSYTIDAKAISLRDNTTSNWRNIFDDNTACGRTSGYVCEHQAFDNFQDSSSQNKQAYDSISCTKLGMVVSGQLDARMKLAGKGKFWCSVQGNRIFDYILTDCSYQIRP